MQDRTTVYHDTFVPKIIPPGFNQAQVEPVMHWLDEEAYFNKCAQDVIEKHR